jgi:WD40 repeat protein
MVQGVERSAASNESQGDPVVITTTVRSIPSSFREGGSIHLNTRYGSTSARQQQDSSSHNQKNAVHGFVDGNFSSGKILDLKLPSRCFVMSYDPSVTVLVVGTATSLEFFDAASQQQQYVVIHSVPCTSMISAVRWIPPPPSNADSHWSHGNANLLLATADLDGNISLYSINFEILEIQGPTLLYSGKNSSGAQIRSLDAGYCHYAGLALLLVAAGDKSGAITIASFQAYSQPPVFIDTIDLLPLQPHYPVGDEPSSKKHDSVLGLALQMELGIMATSTSGGLVQVHSLAHFIFSKSDHTHEAAAILWSRQHKGGAVRCVTVSPSDNLLAFGGYDKTVVLVDTQQWVVARELPLQGTVRILRYVVFNVAYLML